MRGLALALTLFAGTAGAGEICRPVIDPAPPANACMGTERVSLAAVGDVLLHGALQRRGYAREGGFVDMWREVVPYLQAADIAYANLEGPVAPGITKGFRRGRDPGKRFDNSVYTSYPMFNYHPSVLEGLVASGVDVVSTANNHSLDRGAIGADLTLDALKAQDLAYSGTLRRGEMRDFTVRLPSKLGDVVLVACTFSTNGIADRSDQVLMCFEDREEVLNAIRGAASDPAVAAVIAAPHWGAEYVHTPGAAERGLARDLVAAGATAVVATHPHVIQPWEWLPAPDGSEALVIYSTGNFVSGQTPLNKRTGSLAWIELCRARPSAELSLAFSTRASVASAAHLPVVMDREERGPVLRAGDAAATGIAAQGRALAARLVDAPMVRGCQSAPGASPAPDLELVALQ